MTSRTRATLAILAMVAASCTADTDGPSATGVPSTTAVTPSVTSTTIAPDLAIARFRSCLLERGVEVEEVPLDARGRPRLDLVMATLDLTDPETAASVTECAEVLTSGALDLVGDDLLRRIVVSRLEEYSRCMVRNGVEGFPEPLPGFVGIGPPFPVAEIPYADPQLETAAAVCREELMSSLEADL